MIRRLALFLLFALIPYGYIGMQLDFTYNAVIGYIGWGVVFILIGFLTRRRILGLECIAIPFISYGISYICVQAFQNERWSYFFIPFGVEGSLLLFYILSLFGLGIGLLIGKKKKNPAL
ncbi:hypothetical protein ACTHQ4_12995 [Alkalicoccobacillus gibsonii]|uniref:hypothetical protein n=1 Tax=Alkalicoccobacillus gibsonii TaxID=79881 RepID=UPI003F7C30BD